ncbi:MAG: tryptophan-rich hypothetical protein [Hyphomicrobiaceae bacterium]|jgi:tryptophan-rich hypothetical protein
MIRLSPKNLLLSKWTSTNPQNSEKHFIVTRVVLPEPPNSKIEWIEIQAVHSGVTRTIHYQELRDSQVWTRGWISN